MSPRVHAFRCTSCGRVSYPKHAICPKCRGETFEPVEVAGEGVVLTYTDVYALAVDYETRYLRLAIVELDGGLRVTGQLLDERPQIGTRVRTTIGVVREPAGGPIYGLQFLPI
ncbi:MAG: OB-fold domain-containing protein [Candidatus Bipolaricaulota bacterium]